MRLFSTGLYFVTFVAGAIMTGATAWVSLIVLGTTHKSNN